MIIIGGGITGLYLSSLVSDVTVWEKNKEVTEKSCGGLVSTRINELINIKDCVINKIRGARIFVGTTELLVERKKTQAYVISRLELQRKLLSEAESNGTKVLFGKVWKGEKDNMIIGADGAYSSVARYLGIKRKYVKTIEARGILVTEPEYVQVYINSFSPGFFAWVIPEDERNVRLGLGLTKGNLLENFQIFLKKIGARTVEKPRVWGIPIYDGKKTIYEKDGCTFALVGDAAAQVKATSGGGIVFGMLCAEELARAINDGNVFDYERYWRNKYGKILRNHVIIRNIINHMNEPCFRVLKFLGIKQFLERFGDMDTVTR